MYSVFWSIEYFQIEFAQKEYVQKKKKIRRAAYWHRAFFLCLKKN